MRNALLNMGVSQMSAGSRTDVGSYYRGDVEQELKMVQKHKAKEEQQKKMKQLQQSPTGSAADGKPVMKALDDEQVNRKAEC